MRRKPHGNPLPPTVGFLDEREGVRSATRLVMVGLLGLAGCVTLTMCAYVLIAPIPSAVIVASLAGALGTLVVHGAVAVIKR